MEIEDVLKLQNRFIESIGENEKTNELKKFNEELIEKIEFEKRCPLVFSENVVRILDKKGFGFSGYSHGKSYRSYDIYDKFNIKNCRLYHGDNGEIIFMYNTKSYHYEDREFISIPKEDFLTEQYIDELLTKAGGIFKI
jgi:hypothetical protein